VRRRDFIKAVAGSTAIWPRVAHAQQPQVPVVGFLSSLSSAALTAAPIAAFRLGPGSVGYEEGKNVAIEF
jgi:putative ABC transport system substrate-binding protein